MHQKITTMYDATSISATDVLILCGGLGTRLQAVSGGKQKILVELAGKPFIDILIESLLPLGSKRFVLCVGYQRAHVKEHFKSRKLEIVFSEEKEPLGTGGAVKNAMPYVRSSPFLVLNGDSLCRIDYSQFFKFHIQKGGLLSIVLAKPLPETDYGVIDIDSNGRITSFQEKPQGVKVNYINAGIYLLNREVFQFMPRTAKFSLEYDLFPNVLMLGCYGFVVKDEVIDIGTPERYYRAKNIFS
jgi:NDP-sugar pyrophosphorylase family protein